MGEEKRKPSGLLGTGLKELILQTPRMVEKGVLDILYRQRREQRWLKLNVGASTPLSIEPR